MIHRNDFFPGSTQAPPWSASVLRKFGQNRYGENLFRVVFLTSRCYVVGGYWEEDGEMAYRRMPKYGVKEEKWALERYVPTAWLGTPESWDLLGSTLEGYYAIGPYPEHGIFECCAVFSTGFGTRGFMPIEPGIVDLQARAIWMGRSLTRYQVRAAALGMEEEKIRKQDEYFERMVRDSSFSRDNAFGMAVTFNREQAIADYKTKLIRNKAWARKHRFRPGFSQSGEIN